MATNPQAAAQIGGIPTVSLDVPICAVFIAIFVALAAGHMTILQVNLRRGHKFIMNGLCFGFAMSRIMACVFRLVWATQPTNANVSLVASVFLNAGILLIYVINNNLAWRMVRSALPELGWNPKLRLANKVMLFVIIPMILPLIVIIVLRVKNPTLAHIGTATTVVGRLAQTYFLVTAVLPVILLAIAVKAGPKDHFGVNRSWTGKVIVLAISIALAIIEAGFRCGTTWTPAPPATNPAWWDSKAAFYCFNFSIDICVLALLLIGRLDQRFHIPNGANGPMSYSRAVGEEDFELAKESRRVSKEGQ